MGNFENFNQAAPVPEQPVEESKNLKPKKMGAAGSIFTAAMIGVAGIFHGSKAEEAKLPAPGDSLSGQKTEQTAPAPKPRRDRLEVNFNLGALPTGDLPAFDSGAMYKAGDASLQARKTNLDAGDLVPPSSSELLTGQTEEYSVSGNNEGEVYRQAKAKEKEMRDKMKRKAIDFTQGG